MIIIFHICYDIIASHMISIVAIIIVSILFIFMDIRAKKVYGKEPLSTIKLIRL